MNNRFKVICSTAVIILSAAPNAALAEQWIDFGAAKGEQLQLDTSSVMSIKMPVDDRINMEGGADEGSKVPMRKVISFKYKIGGRTRSAYTISCDGKKLKSNPSWRTATTYIDYWPQYFSVKADSPSSKQMLKNVCILGIANKK